jgi:hypothetical protein
MQTAMRFLGYGEDALTLWALQNRLDEILQPFGDSSENVRDVFFRPSFGRRSIGRVDAMPGPQFGEFDAIVTSSMATYLIEAKWTGSGEIGAEGVTLRSEQLRRHRVFREYLTRWRTASPLDWATFVTSEKSLHWLAADDVAQEFALARNETRLAENLEFVLKACAAGGEKIVDLLLVVHPSGDSRHLLPPDNFQCVELSSPPVVGNFIQFGGA